MARETDPVRFDPVPFDGPARRPPLRRAAVAATTAGLMLAAALGVAIVWAITLLPIGDSFARIVADPWGIVTLLDLYAGFFFAIALVFLVERRLLIAAPVALAILTLGNLATAAWVVWRLRRLAGAFKR
jgi:predicted membrane-bound dolichyl-phosphate-mannose-protein mannosyltransferase